MLSTPSIASTKAPARAVSLHIKALNKLCACNVVVISRSYQKSNEEKSCLKTVHACNMYESHLRTCF